MRNKTFLLFLFIPFLIACGEEIEEETVIKQPLDFQSLKADKDTLISGETTSITAVATGYELTYYWSATTGAILGSGARVTYASSPCDCGKSRITCQVMDGYDQTDTKTVVIFVQ
jgi:hypothetical protein